MRMQGASQSPSAVVPGEHEARGRGPSTPRQNWDEQGLGPRLRGHETALAYPFSSNSASALPWQSLAMSAGDSEIVSRKRRPAWLGANG
jgi:hypothetical protein